MKTITSKRKGEILIDSPAPLELPKSKLTRQDVLGVAAIVLLGGALCRAWIALAEMAGAQSPLPHP